MKHISKENFKQNVLIFSCEMDMSSLDHTKELKCSYNPAFNSSFWLQSFTQTKVDQQCREKFGTPDTFCVARALLNAISYKIL